MDLRNVTYEQAKGRFFRKDAWDAVQNPKKGYAYFKEDGKIYFSSPNTTEYEYGRHTNTDWYECDENLNELTRIKPNKLTPKAKSWREKTLDSINAELYLNEHVDQ